jgi:hypothetical protein
VGRRLLTVSALGIVWLVSLPTWSGMSTVRGVVLPPDWFKKANPFLLVYAPYSWPGYVGLTDVAIFVAALHSRTGSRPSVCRSGCLATARTRTRRFGS